MNYPPNLNAFIAKLTRLNRGVTKYGKAPHKPILLLAILELFEKGIIKENRVYVNTDLVGTFQENWRLLVTTLNTPDFTQPFYYLQTEKFEGAQFWFLLPKPGCQINAYIKSVNTLAAVLDYGYFSAEVFLLLADAAARAVITNALLDAYFPDTKNTFIQSKRSGGGYMNSLESYVLNEPEVQYKVKGTETEEENYVRGGLFKKLVPKVYQSTCCITGMRLESSFGHTFIDACHIMPFSISHDDRVTNGIALCPNLHRAFDRGLITIDTSYRVLASNHIIENDGHPYNLKQLNGRMIMLPGNELYFPKRENLEWHLGKIFKE